MRECFYSSFPSASPWMPSIQLQPPEAPRAEHAQVGRQRRKSHRHLGAHQEESPEGKEANWREGAREGGRREGGGEREERGRDRGETLEQRNEELGLAGGAGKELPEKGVWSHLGMGQGAR